MRRRNTGRPQLKRRHQHVFRKDGTEPGMALSMKIIMMNTEFRIFYLTVSSLEIEILKLKICNFIFSVRAQNLVSNFERMK